MSEPAKLTHTKHINKILKIQLVLITTITFLIYVYSGRSEAQAYILGSMTAWFAHYIFATKVFKFVGAKQKSSIVNAMYLGQIQKWLITVVCLLTLLLFFKDLPKAFLMLGFIATQLKNWLFVFIK